MSPRSYRIAPTCRREIFAGKKNVPLPTLGHHLALNVTAVAAGA